MTAARRRLVAGRARTCPPAPATRSRSTAASPCADPRALRLPDGPEGPAEVVDLAALRVGRRRLGRACALAGRGASTSCTSAPSPPRARSTPPIEPARPPGRPRRRPGRGDAAGQLPRTARLGLRRRRAVRRARAVRRTRTPSSASSTRATPAGSGSASTSSTTTSGPSGNRLPDFGPYFTDHYRTPWGAAVNLDGAGSDEVRRFIIDNALRLAARLPRRRAAPRRRARAARRACAPAAGGAVGRRRRRSPTRPGGRCGWSRSRTATTRAPSRPASEGGLGLHAQWADDVHHGLHVLLTGETQGYYGDFAAPGALAKVLTGVFLHDGTWSSFRGRTHGRPVDRAGTPGLAVRGLAADPRPGRQPGHRRPALGHRSTRARWPAAPRCC